MSQSIFPLLIVDKFIPSLWFLPSTELTREYADLHYLRFPIAQGSETIPANLTVSGITSLGVTNTATISSSGLVSANAGLTVSAGTTSLQGTTVTTLTNSGVQTNTGGISGAGAISTSGGLTVSAGTTSLSGLTMGGSNNITLGNGATLPTTGTQLGGCGTKIIIASATLTTSAAEYRTFTLPNAGTYLITTNIVFNYGGGTSTAGTARYWWGITSAAISGMITGTDVYGFIPANATSGQYISLSNQAFIYQTPATPVALYLNAYCVVTTTVLPTILASSSYIQYTRIA